MCCMYSMSLQDRHKIKLIKVRAYFSIADCTKLYANNVLHFTVCITDGYIGSYMKTAVYVLVKHKDDISNSQG